MFIFHVKLHMFKDKESQEFTCKTFIEVKKKPLEISKGKIF